MVQKVEEKRELKKLKTRMQDLLKVSVHSLVETNVTWTPLENKMFVDRAKRKIRSATRKKDNDRCKPRAARVETELGSNREG